MTLRFKIFMASVLLLPVFTVLNTHAQEENSNTCDCNTIIVSDEEARNGCPASVKEKTCELFRETLMRKEQLQREQELRRLERSVEPRYGTPR